MKIIVVAELAMIVDRLPVLVTEGVALVVVKVVGTDSAEGKINVIQHLWHVTVAISSKHPAPLIISHP